MDVLFYVLIGIAAVGLLIIASVLVFNRDRAKQSRGRARRRDRALVVREATRRLAQDPRDVPALQDLAEIAPMSGSVRRRVNIFRARSFCFTA